MCIERELAEMHGKGPRMTTRIDRDGSLVTALRRGDPTAAEDLVTAYGDRAYRLATRITGNPQDAEEAVQDAFLSAIRKIDSFRGESAFGSWLYRYRAGVIGLALTVATPPGNDARGRRVAHLRAAVDPRVPRLEVVVPLDCPPASRDARKR